jgi:hypothetical protein
MEYCGLSQRSCEWGGLREPHIGDFFEKGPSKFLDLGKFFDGTSERNDMPQKDNILKLPARLVEELGGQGTYMS